MSLDIRYFAGFFDGEGCVAFHYQKGSRSIRPMAEVSQTKLPILMEYKKRFGGTVVGPIQNDIRSKPHWKWIALSNVCLEFLEKIKTHVTVKKPQVKLMLKYAKWKRSNKKYFQRNSRGTGNQRTPETMRMLESWRSQMKKLNKRGV